MSYLVLARKYRPQTFDEVVGQTHVTTTLSNAISAGRVAHALLFSGPRGTGKTTVARILAKTINCEKNRETPSAIPCNTCRSCTEITAGSATDVFEIDGASNNSVDQVRELRENVRYMPAHSPFKIYIIDEVHMLSAAAFNALLKTLEEPPAHVKFMFATTEPHKIPITILSRCQKHDMRRVESGMLISYMKELCSREEMAVAEKSLTLIAREAGGSVRDALSLLDQVLSCSTGEIDHNQVLNILGTVDRQNLYDLSSAILNKRPDEVLSLIAGIYDRGADLKKFYAGLTEHFRNLLVAGITRSPGSLIDLPEHETALMREQTASVSPAFLSQILDLLFKEESGIRFASNPKIAIEIALLKLLQIEPALTIDTLIEKIDTLRKSIDAGAALSVGNPEPPPYGQTTADSGPEPDTRPQPQHQETRPPDNPSEPKKPDHPVWNQKESHETSWERFMNWFYEASPPLAPSLTGSRLKSAANGIAEIVVSGSKFNIQRIMTEKNRMQLESACRQFFGADFRIELIPDYKQAELEQKKKEQSDQRKQEVLKNPVVAEAVKVFNGHIETRLL